MTSSGQFQINEDLAFQRRTWVVERVCWLLMAVLLAAALSGLFAVGPLSNAETEDPDSVLHIQYQRFLRKQAPSNLRVVLSPGAASGSVAAIRMSGEFLEHMKIERIVPQPFESRSTDNGVEFRFQIADPGKPATVRFFLEPQATGRISGELGVSGRKPAQVSAFVYP